MCPCTYAPAVPPRHSRCWHRGRKRPRRRLSFSGVARGASLMATQSLLTSRTCTAQPVRRGTPAARCPRISRSSERVYDLRKSHAFAAANMSLGGGGFTGFCDGTHAGHDRRHRNLRSVRVATVVVVRQRRVPQRLSFPACISSAISVGATRTAPVRGRSRRSGVALLEQRLLPIAPCARATHHFLGSGRWIRQRHRARRWPRRTWRVLGRSRSRRIRQHLSIDVLIGVREHREADLRSR